MIAGQTSGEFDEVTETTSMMRGMLDFCSSGEFVICSCEEGIKVLTGTTEGSNRRYNAGLGIASQLKWDCTSPSREGNGEALTSLHYLTVGIQ